jgi:streptogramin lyase
MSNLKPCLYLSLWTLIFAFCSCQKNNSSSNSGGSGAAGTTTPPPTVTGIQPSAGYGGKAVTISGSGFTASTQDSVYFNGVKATVYSASDTQIVATVPSLCGSGKVSVTINGTSYAGPVFTYDTVYAIKPLATGLNNPQHIAADSNGNIYVANFGDGTISKISSDGTLTTFASGFMLPHGVTTDSKNNVYVAANPGSGAIYEISPAGVVDSLAATATYLWGITADAEGNLYAIGDNGSISYVTKVTPTGSISTLGGGVGTGISTGICVNSAGTLYVAQDHATLYAVSSSGSVSSLVLSGNTTGMSPSDVTVNTNGDFYITSYGNSSIYQVPPSGVASVIATGLYSPIGITHDKYGNLYVVSFISSGTVIGQVEELIAQ